MDLQHLEITEFRVVSSSPQTQQGPCGFAWVGHSTSNDTTFCLPSLRHNESWVLSLQVRVLDTVPLTELWSESLRYSYWCRGNGGAQKLYRPPAESILLRGLGVETRTLNISTTGYLGYPLMQAQQVAADVVGGGTAVAIGDTVTVDVPIYVPRGHLANMFVTARLALPDVSESLGFAESLAVVDSGGVAYSAGRTGTFSSNTVQQLGFTALQRSGTSQGGLMRLRMALVVRDVASSANATAHVVTVSVRFGNTAKPLFESTNIHALVVAVPAVHSSLALRNLNASSLALVSRGDAGDFIALTHILDTHTLAAAHGLGVAVVYDEMFNTDGSVVRYRQLEGAAATDFADDAAWVHLPTDGSPGAEPATPGLTIPGAAATVSAARLSLLFPLLKPGSRLAVEHIVRLDTLAPAYQLLEAAATVSYASAPVSASRGFMHVDTANMTTFGFADVAVADVVPPQPLATTGTFARHAPGDLTVGETATIVFEVSLPEGVADDVYATFTLSGSGVGGAALPFELLGGAFVAAPGSNIDIADGLVKGDPFGPTTITTGTSAGSNTTAGRLRRATAVPAISVEGDKLVVYSPRITNNPDNVQSDKDTLAIRLQVAAKDLPTTTSGDAVVLKGEVVSNATRIQTADMLFTIVEPILQADLEVFKVPAAQTTDLLVSFQVDISHTNTSFAPASQVAVNFSFNKTAKDAWLYSASTRSISAASKNTLEFQDVVAPVLRSGNIGGNSSSDAGPPVRTMAQAVVALNKSSVADGDRLCGIITLSWRQPPASPSPAAAGRTYQTEAIGCYTHSQPGGSEDAASATAWQIGFTVAITLVFSLLAVGIVYHRQQLRRLKEPAVLSSVALPRSALTGGDAQNDEWNVVIDMVNPALPGEYGVIGHSVYGPGGADPALEGEYGLLGGAVGGKPQRGLAYRDEAEEEYDNIQGQLNYDRHSSYDHSADEADEEYANVGMMLARSSNNNRGHGIPRGEGLFAGRVSQKAGGGMRASAARAMATIPNHGYGAALPAGSYHDGDTTDDDNDNDSGARRSVSPSPFPSRSEGTVEDLAAHFVMHVIRRAITAALEDAGLEQTPRRRASSRASSAAATDWGTAPKSLLHDLAGSPKQARGSRASEGEFGMLRHSFSTNAFPDRDQMREASPDGGEPQTRAGIGNAWTADIDEAAKGRPPSIGFTAPAPSPRISGFQAPTPPPRSNGFAAPMPPPRTNNAQPIVNVVEAWSSTGEAMVQEPPPVVNDSTWSSFAEEWGANHNPQLSAVSANIGLRGSSSVSHLSFAEDMQGLDHKALPRRSDSYGRALDEVGADDEVELPLPAPTSGGLGGLVIHTGRTLPRSSRTPSYL